MIGEVRENPKTHILLKVRSEHGLTIDAHSHIIAEKGAAFFGKFGDGIGKNFQDELNNQIKQGIKTYLFLLTKESLGKLSIYQCLLKQVHEVLQEDSKILVPRYYIHKSSFIKTWFEITTMKHLTREEMDRIYLLDSGHEIQTILSEHETAFRVGFPKPS